MPDAIVGHGYGLRKLIDAKHRKVAVAVDRYGVPAIDDYGYAYARVLAGRKLFQSRCHGRDVGGRIRRLLCGGVMR